MILLNPSGLNFSSQGAPPLGMKNFSLGICNIIASLKMIVQYYISGSHYNHDVKFAHLVKGGRLNLSLFVPFRNAATLILRHLIRPRSGLITIARFRTRTRSCRWRSRKSHSRLRSEKTGYIKVSVKHCVSGLPTYCTRVELATLNIYHVCLIIVYAMS